MPVSLRRHDLERRVSPEITRVLATLLLVVFPCLAVAENTLDLRGFVNLGATRSESDQLLFRRHTTREGLEADQWSLKPDSALGIQFDAALSERFSAALQLIENDSPDDVLADYVNWGYVRYWYNENIMARAGKLGMNLYMLTEYMDLGFAYLWVRPPVEFYGFSFDTINGADLAYSNRLGEGTFKTRLFVGESKNDFQFQGRELTVELKAVYGISATWEDNVWLLRVSLSEMQLDSSVDKAFGTYDLRQALAQAQVVWPEAAALGEELDPRGGKIQYYSLGVSYDKNNWNLQSEWGGFDSEFSLFRPFVTFYVSGGYRFGEVTPYLLFSKIRNTGSRVQVPQAPDIPGLSELQLAVQQAYDAVSMNQQTTALGVRWNIGFDLALKLQVDRTKVNPHGGALFDRVVPVDTQQKFNTYSLMVNYVF